MFYTGNETTQGRKARRIWAGHWTEKVHAQAGLWDTRRCSLKTRCVRIVVCVTVVSELLFFGLLFLFWRKETSFPTTHRKQVPFLYLCCNTIRQKCSHVCTLLPVSSVQFCALHTTYLLYIHLSFAFIFRLQQSNRKCNLVLRLYTY